MRRLYVLELRLDEVEARMDARNDEKLVSGEVTHLSFKEVAELVPGFEWRFVGHESNEDSGIWCFQREPRGLLLRVKGGGGTRCSVTVMRAGSEVVIARYTDRTANGPVREWYVTLFERYMIILQNYRASVAASAKQTQDEKETDPAKIAELVRAHAFDTPTDVMGRRMKAAEARWAGVGCIGLIVIGLIVWFVLDWFFNHKHFWQSPPM